MGKKTIALVTNWYPTEENPYSGGFFREQAIAVKEHYDFIVIHYRENKSMKLAADYNLTRVKEEENIREYRIDVSVPRRVVLVERKEKLDMKLGIVKTDKPEGVGEIMPMCRKYFTKKMVGQIVQNEKELSFDALYCVDAQSEAFVLKCFAESAKKPYVVAEHAPIPWPGRVLNDANKDAIEKADLFLAISHDKIRQSLLLNIKLPKTFYIGNLVDETQFLLKSENLDNADDAIGASRDAEDENKKADEEDGKTILTVGANAFFKHYDLFIEAMNRLTEITDKNFSVMVVGYAADEGYAKDREGFEAKIKNSKFADRVGLIPSVPHSEICNIYPMADVYVITSIQEGQPVAVMEAACCGLPIFATRCGGVEDYVDDKMGRIYDVDDAEGIASGLKDYLEGRLTFDPEYIRGQVINRFGKEAFVKNFVKAFDGVMEI